MSTLDELAMSFTAKPRKKNRKTKLLENISMDVDSLDSLAQSFLNAKPVVYEEKSSLQSVKSDFMKKRAFSSIENIVE